VTLRQRRVYASQVTRMTLDELRAKWAARAAEFETLGAMVSASMLCRAILDDLELVPAGSEEAMLSIAQASAYSGYSRDHLARLVRQGKLRTLRQPGSRGRYRFRQGDLPQKPSSMHPIDAGVHELASRLSRTRGKEGHYGRS
jgi:hypothetical protein